MRTKLEPNAALKSFGLFGIESLDDAVLVPIRLCLEMVTDGEVAYTLGGLIVLKNPLCPLLTSTIIETSIVILFSLLSM